MNISLLAQVQTAFDSRARPSRDTDSNELTDDEKLSLAEIFRLNWKETTPNLWERNSEVVSWLSPEGYCYYLPGIISSSLQVDCPNLAAVCSVLFDLDRTPDKTLWDDFFYERWKLLDRQELEAVESWLYWISSTRVSVFDDVSIIRALQNIELLRTDLQRA